LDLQAQYAPLRDELQAAVTRVMDSQQFILGPDIKALEAECRFSDCAHATEPGCAVQAALEDGSLPVRRYESWQKLQREAAFMARRTDMRLRAEAKKAWARQSKDYRRDVKPRR